MEKYTDLLTKIENMSVLELNELVKAIEEKFGVSAATVSTVSAGAAVSSEEAEVKTSFTVQLVSAGEGKIAVMKVVKEVLGLGLKEAKDLVDSAPADIKKDLKKEEAESFKKALEGAGATVVLK